MPEHAPIEQGRGTCQPARAAQTGRRARTGTIMTKPRSVCAERRRGARAAAATALIAALALVAAPAPAKKPKKYGPAPPTEGGLIDNVRGYSFDEAGRLVRFTGLLVKDGKVKALLAAGDKRPEWLDFRIDEHGRVMIPGLFDAHGHVMGLGYALTRLDLADTTTLAGALTRLAAYAQAHRNPAWVQGFGWNQERWGLGRFPTAADIDPAVPDRPVVLERVDGHAVLANTAAMRAAGVTAATQDPPGGHIERDARGRPTGVFVDAARALIEKAAPAPAPIERDTALAKAQEALLAVGVTATADMGTRVEDWEVMRRAGDRGALRVRIVSYGSGVDTALAIAGSGPTPWLYQDHLRMVGVKLYADGALGSRGAWLKRPYADKPETRGLAFMDDTRIRNLMSRAAMDNFQVAVHAIGDAANAQVLDAIDELAQTYKGDRRWRIEHAQIVDPADLPRFAQHGIVASMQPTHETSDWTMAGERLGPDRLRGAYAWATMLAEHVPLAFGSDYPVESPNPFPGLAAAISREDAQGRPPGGWQPQERITAEQAVAAFTIGAAYAAGAEDRLGTLEPGKLADFVIVDQDPFTTDAATLRGAHALETWVGGVRVYERK